MAWTYVDLKAADAALGIAEPAQAAAALNAQRRTEPADVATSDARQVILLSGEWFKIKQLAKAALTGTAQDQVVAAANICIDTMTMTDTLRVSDDAAWAAIQPMISGLVAAGVLSQASADAWAALRNASVPTWVPELDAGHIQTARVQP